MARSLDNEIVMAISRLFREGTSEDNFELSRDREILREYLKRYVRPDDTTTLTTELVKATVAKAEELGFYIRNQTSEVHRDLREGDSVVFAIRLVRKLPDEVSPTALSHN